MMLRAMSSLIMARFQAHFHQYQIPSIAFDDGRDKSEANGALLSIGILKRTMTSPAYFECERHYL